MNSLANALKLTIAIISTTVAVSSTPGNVSESPVTDSHAPCKVTVSFGSADVQDTSSPVSESTSDFTFLDVFRNVHEMSVDSGAAKNKYSAEAFSYSDSSPNGNRLVRESDNTEYSDSDHSTQTRGYTGIISYDDDRYTSKFGIDVSKFQGNINWKKVKEAGVSFAFVRIGYRGYGSAGTLNFDKYYKQNIEGAQAEGLDVGVYFYAQAINEEEAIEEAEYVISLLDGYQLSLPVVYDPEHVLNDDARTDNVSGEQFTKNSVAFCKTIKDAGLEPMIYANMMWEAYELDMSELKDIPMWYADYELLPQSPYMFDVWQYSQAGHIPGIDGAVDLNVMFIEK